MTPDRQAPPAVRWTALQGGSWEDGGCWDLGPCAAPGRARLLRPSGGRRRHHRHARGRWPASRWISATRTQPVKLGGSGTLVLTGADRFLGKPVALQVADGTLHLAAPLRIEVAAPRFGAHAGGTLIVATPHVRAVA